MRILIEGLITSEFTLAEAIELILEYTYGERIETVISRLNREINKHKHEVELLDEEEMNLREKGKKIPRKISLRQEVLQRMIDKKRSKIERLDAATRRHVSGRRAYASQAKG